VSVIDVGRHAVTATLKIDRTAPKPKGVIVHPNGKIAYVSNGGSNDVAVIDVEAGQISGYIPVGRRPWGLGLTADGRKLYVANGVSDNISVIDTESRKVIGTIRAGKGPWGVAVGR